MAEEKSNQELDLEQHSTSGFWLFFQAFRLRLRFLLLFGFLAAIAILWPWLTNGWARAVSFLYPKSMESGVASNQEYFCPMDPGVVSVWPAICPVCNMDLITRKKGDAAILPSGVLARMQFSPYRLMMAGVHTVPVLERPSEDDAGSVRLLVPITSVVHRSTETLLYVESSPGMIDGVRVTLGDQFGDLCEVTSSNVKAGQKVVSMGTLLVDAENRLNPNLSTQYLGASDQWGVESKPKVTRRTQEAALGKSPLSAEDQSIVDKQRFCPVTRAELGSMGTPLLITIGDRKIAICCEGCKAGLIRKPEIYLEWLDQQHSRDREAK